MVDRLWLVSFLLAAVAAREAPGRPASESTSPAALVLLQLEARMSSQRRTEANDALGRRSDMVNLADRQAPPDVATATRHFPGTWMLQEGRQNVLPDVQASPDLTPFTAFRALLHKAHDWREECLALVLIIYLAVVIALNARQPAELRASDQRLLQKHGEHAGFIVLDAWSVLDSAKAMGKWLVAGGKGGTSSSMDAEGSLQQKWGAEILERFNKNFAPHCGGLSPRNDLSAAASPFGLVCEGRGDFPAPAQSHGLRPSETSPAASVEQKQPPPRAKGAESGVEEQHSDSLVMTQDCDSASDSGSDDEMYEATSQQEPRSDCLAGGETGSRWQS